MTAPVHPAVEKVAKLRARIADLVYRCKTDPARPSHNSDAVADRIMEWVKQWAKEVGEPIDDLAEPARALWKYDGTDDERRNMARACVLALPLLRDMEARLRDLLALSLLNPRTRRETWCRPIPARFSPATARSPREDRMIDTAAAPAEAREIIAKVLIERINTPHVLADAILAALAAKGLAVAPVNHDPHVGPCPTCGFRIRPVERQPFDVSAATPSSGTAPESLAPPRSAGQPAQAAPTDAARRWRG